MASEPSEPSVRRFGRSGAAPTAGAEPAPEVLEAIRAHLAAEHGRELDRQADVGFPGRRPPEAIVDLDPARADRPARYHCLLCGLGRVYLVGEPLAGPERWALLRRREPGLRALLKGVPGERWDELTAAWERGELGPALVDQALARGRQQTKRPSPRAVRQRREGAQGWMLRRYAEVGNVEAVLDELAELLSRPGPHRLEILGQDVARAKDTLRKDWRAIPGEKRKAAKRRYEARPEPERTAEAKARRLAKATG